MPHIGGRTEAQWREFVHMNTDLRSGGGDLVIVGDDLLALVHAAFAAHRPPSDRLAVAYDRVVETAKAVRDHDTRDGRGLFRPGQEPVPPLHFLRDALNHLDALHGGRAMEACSAETKIGNPGDMVARCHKPIGHIDSLYDPTPGVHEGRITWLWKDSTYPSHPSNGPDCYCGGC